MKQSGITTDGKPVFAGVFPLMGTHGVPLEIILHNFMDTNRVVDWPDYIKSALKDGHKPRTIKARILAAVGDVYGSAYKKEIEARLSEKVTSTL